MRMNGETWEIIGVVAKRKAGFFGENEEDRKVFMPYRTARKAAPQRDFLLLIVQAKEGFLNDAVNDIEVILRQRRGVKYGESRTTSMLKPPTTSSPNSTESSAASALPRSLSHASACSLAASA